MANPDPKFISFRTTLQEDVSVFDKEWSYHISGLPSPPKLNEQRCIKVIALETKDGKHRITLRLQKINPNRGIAGDPLDKFAVVSIAAFRPLVYRGSDTNTPTGNQPKSGKECTDYVVKMLREGIHIQGVHYNFYSHSNSQLKSRTCFLFAGTKEEISKKVEALGDFGKLKTVQKKAKRIGLLFSEARAAMIVPQNRCEDIADIETADYNFTDGCGLIAPHLAQDLARRVRIVHRNTRYTPSVFQIRYRGYKGVLMVDPKMKGGTWIKFRKSMKKFSGGEDLSFSVVEYSKPYSFGHLNDEVILLLHSLGISSSTLLRKQQQHFDFLNDAVNDPRAAFRFLTYINQHELAEKLLMESLGSIKSQVAKFVGTEYAKLIKEGEKRKTRILVPQSRLVFGICDPWGVLKEGECAVKITNDGDGVPRALKGTEIIVTRNPCWHPGDLQKLRVVEKDELAHLVDCIVFPTRGRRPPADMMSGGDLDGDTFFVCWDPELIPSKVSQPAEYPGAREPLSFKPISDDDRLVYFAKYTNASLGKLKNLHVEWARALGPMSSQCQELNRLYSTCVDGNSVKIPPKLEKAPEPHPDAEAFILDQLHDAARKAERPSANSGANIDDYSFGAVELLLNRDDVAMSEFELINLVFRWCQRNQTPFTEFLHLFNFNILTSEEKIWTISQLPPSDTAASLVRNALCQSSLLEERELRDFKLHYPGLGWKRIYDSSCERLATFPETLSMALETFHRKLVVFRVDERLTLGMYVPRKIMASSESRVDNLVRLFAFPHSRGDERASRLSRPTKTNYHIYCDDNMFQLYEQQRANTWVYMVRSRGDDSSYRNIPRAGDRRRGRQETVDSGQNFDCRCSVALDKFSRGLQTHIGRVNRNGIIGAEIYVISNRDVKSMQILDLWWEYIDTQEVVPLFEQNAREYSLPTMSNVDWATLPPYMTPICRDKDLAALEELDSIEQYSTLFAWLLDRSENDLLLKIFEHLMTRFIEDDPVELLAAPGRRSITVAMLDCLARRPHLVVVFTRAGDMDVLPEDLATTLEAYSPEILKACLQSASTMQELIIHPVKNVLSRTTSMTLRTFSDIVKVASLTIRSPDLAMDILLECLERESERILGSSRAISEHFTRCLIGIAMDHIGEAAEEARTREDLFDLKLLLDQCDGYAVVEAEFRIDAKGGTPEQSAHVRLTASSPPSNSLLGRTYSMDALVVESQQGKAKFQCFHPPPPFLTDCSWKLQYLGPYVTTKTMLDAVVTLATDQEVSCGIVDVIIANSGIAECQDFLEKSSATSFNPTEAMNSSQKAAIDAALGSRLTCLWGPPGTGKTSTIVEIIKGLILAYPKERILVTAPTHNAVDNVMSRYLDKATLQDHSQQGNGSTQPHSFPVPLRVSTEVRKVSENLRKYTCDALAGAEIHSSFAAHKAAQKRIKESRLIFTTCIGTGLGLLRKESFGIVIVDEASQQTEPASLVPLVKGCQKAVLVGDHVQLRPTVQQHAAAQGFDVSLFERLYTAVSHDQSIKKVMLDTQYRMHETICKFSSDEFYDSELKTGVSPSARPLFDSVFPWPKTIGTGGDVSRMVFVECAVKEDLGHKSKSNMGQANLCLEVCKFLRTRRMTTAASTGTGRSKGKTSPVTVTENNPDQDVLATQSIAVLTPYTRQADLLKTKLANIPAVEICSIDGFQGREADIVVFVTVRCNEHGEIGFLKDLRRLNVAMTRARCGVVVIGNRTTLTSVGKSKGVDEEGAGDLESDYEQVWGRLVRGLVEVKLDNMVKG